MVPNYFGSESDNLFISGLSAVCTRRQILIKVSEEEYMKVLTSCNDIKQSLSTDISYFALKGSLDFLCFPAHSPSFLGITFRIQLCIVLGPGDKG
jgi:hypothetical protein